jgi:hypothetical protein
VIDWLEVVAWMGAFVVLHEGVARRFAGNHDKRAVVMILMSMLILILGTCLWFWNARTYHQLAEALRVPTANAQKRLSREQIESLPAAQRRDATIQWARAAFVSGGDLLSVLTEDGRRMPYAPGAADIQARDHQLKLLDEVQSRKDALDFQARLAEREAQRWLASLLVALGTGAIASRSRARPT